MCRPWLEQEIALVNPRLIIPIGRLAIGRFYDAKLPLEKIVGTKMERDGQVIIPLPHPSGARTWHHKPENAALIKQAIGLIRKERVALGL